MIALALITALAATGVLTPTPASAAGAAPLGWFDGLSSVTGGIRVRGWAFDPDDPTRAITIRVYIDGAFHSGHVARGNRPDVARAHPSAGPLHGLDTVIGVDRRRNHDLCLWAIDSGGSGPNRLLGCRRVPATPYLPGTDVRVNGRGWGHGRGMGQYGALGYAVYFGSTATQILNWFYGGTSAATTPNGPIRVRINRASGTWITVTAGGPAIRMDGHTGSYGAIRFMRSGNGVRIQTGPSCAGPFSDFGSVTTVAKIVRPPAQFDDSAANDLQLCEGSSRRHYAGAFEISMHSGRTELVNVVNLEPYLRGVVPREVPAAWASLGGGRGAAAVRAQAVAARSYAVGEDRSSWYATCDTTDCQVYGGRGITTSLGFDNYEDARTDTAVRATVGSIRRMSSTGAVARTEFSSSTGGYTAGGTFPAVPDAGDAIPSNPNHSWADTVPVNSIVAHYRRGDLLELAVRTTGVGPDGGRAATVRLRFTGATIIESALTFRVRFGLRSEWFRFP